MGDAPPGIDDGAGYQLLSSGFIPNLGQCGAGVEYVLQHQGTAIFFTKDGFVLSHASGDIIRQSFAGASPERGIAPIGQRAGVASYYVGNDPSKWLSGIPVYSGIVYEGLYPGIDLVYTERDGRLKREFHVSPGADPSQIELIYEGESLPHIDGAGVLRFTSPAGEMLESPLVCWQVIDGVRLDRAAGYVVDCGSVRIDVAGYDAEYELIIDPELVYSSYLGGSDADYGRSLAPDGDGGVWVTGYTGSHDFPVTDGSNGEWGHTAFVSHFSPDGALLSSTCLGGGGADYGRILVDDGAGGVWVMGETTSDDFPIQNASQDHYGGEGDLFVSHFSSSGTLLSSTYLGGERADRGDALVGDGAGGVWVTGFTTSNHFPVTDDAYQKTYGGDPGDAFVSHFSSSGALLSSTYLGGENYDYGSALAGDGAGGVWVMGGSEYDGFPVTDDAFQKTNKGGWDLFVSHFSSSGTLLSSTYLGGGGTDRGDALVGDNNGGVWITGETWSHNFPVQNESQESYGGGSYDAFVSHFSSTGALLSSTYLGGGETDSGSALVGDGAGGVWVTGDTRSADFPIKNASQEDYGGGNLYGDIFVSHFSPDGALLSSTYLGGEGDERDHGAGRVDDYRYTLAGDGAGGVWVTGCTDSTDFPLQNASQSAYGEGSHDAFVSHFSPSGALLLSTYLGGENYEYGSALAGDGAGGVWVTGFTTSTDFPVKRAYQVAPGGNGDLFIAKFGSSLPALPRAELILNANYNRYAQSDRISSGTASCRLAYITTVHNLPENLENISGNLSFTLDAPNIVDIGPEEYAEINGTEVTWTFPRGFTIKPGTTLSTQAATSAWPTRRSNLTLERSCNRTNFAEAGVQQVTLNMTLDAIDLDGFWGRIECFDTGVVQARIIPDTISTNLPGSDLSQESATRIQFTADRFKLEAGRQYTLSCAVEVTPLRPVTYAPACAVWEVRDSKSRVAPAGTRVALPADLLPQNVTSLEFSSDTSCEWTCAHNDHLVTSIRQLDDPLSPPATNITANFTANVTTGPAPLTVRFTDQSTGNVTSWAWNFGDGNTSTEQDPTHIYTAPGSYTVNLTVSSGAGSDTLSRPDYIIVTVRGDFNGNGVVDIGDVSKVAYMVVGRAPADPAADFNGNGRVDIGDAAKIAYYFVGKIDLL